MGWMLPLVLLIAFEAVADVLAKEYSLRGTVKWWLLAIGFYVLANSFWLYAIRQGSGLTRGALIFSVGSAVLAIIIGILFYKESLTKVELAGVILGVVALGLISWHE